MITPAAGFQVDPNNANGVIPISNAPVNSIVPTTPAPPVTPAKVTSPVTPNTPIVPVSGAIGAQTAENAASVAKAANAGKSGYDVFGNAVAGGSSNQDTLRSNGGTHTGLDGVTQYYNYDNTPVGASTASTNTSGTSNGTTNTDPNSPTLSDQADRQALAKAQADYQNTANSVQTTIANIQNGVTPLNAGENAQIAGLQKQFQALIDAQNLANKGAVGGATVNSFATGAYSPLFQMNTINQIASAGVAKVSDLQIKEAQAVAQLTQSFKDNDIKAVQNAWAIYQDASKERTDALQKTITDTQAAIKSAQDAQVAADKVYQDTVQKPINDLAQVAKNTGAPSDVVAKIMAAGSLTDAYNAAGNYAAQGTGIVAEYNYAKANGYTGSFSQYQTEDANRKAVATSGSLDTLSPTPIVGLGADSSGGSILSQTGLSVAAFNFLTQGTASLSRMSATQRAQVMNEAQNYLNKTGTDISTFQSQYKAYNSVLEANIERANNTKIFAGEITGTVDQFINDIGNEFGNLKVGNVGKLLAGGQINDATVQKYSFDLQTMQNDLAGYYAASRTGGSNATPDDSDKRAAADVIVNGLNGKSAAAFKTSILANEAKVADVVNKNVDSTRQQVWGLFGVGDKYKSGGGNSTMDNTVATQQEAKTKINTYIQSNPDKADNIAKLYETPSSAFGGGLPTDEQIAEYLNL